MAPAVRSILCLCLRKSVIGDYVLVHAGFAIQKVEQESAHEALKVISAIIEDMEKEIASGDA